MMNYDNYPLTKSMQGDDLPRASYRPTEETYIKHEMRRLRKQVAAQRRLIQARKKLMALSEECQENARFIEKFDVRPEYMRRS